MWSSSHDDYYIRPRRYDYDDHLDNHRDYFDNNRKDYHYDDHRDYDNHDRFFNRRYRHDNIDHEFDKEFDNLKHNSFKSEHHYDNDFRDEFQKVFGFTPEKH